VSQCQPLTISGDGRTVAWAQPEGDTGQGIVLLNVETGQQTRVDLRGQPGFPTAFRWLALSPDGTRLVSQHWGVTLLWDLNRPLPTRVPSPGPGWHIVAFAPDGKDLAVGFGTSDIGIVDARTGRQKQTLRGHAAWVNCLAFAADGKMLVSGSEDGTVRLWDPRTGDLRSTFTGHGGTVVSLAISADGTAIASCSLDQTVRVWRAATQAEVKQNPGSVEEIERRLETQIRARNWKQAAAELSEALDSLVGGTEQWHRVAFWLAFVLAYAGETEKYQALCQRTVRDFQQTTNALIASRTAQMCFFAGIAHHPDVMDKAGRLAQVALASVEGSIARKERPVISLDGAQRSMAIVEYRRGNYAAALGLFQARVDGAPQNRNWNFYATLHLYLAMAAHHLGKTDAAHKWLAEARRLISSLPGPDDTDWLMMDLVRREAEALLAGKKQ
jgi:hypothetical protein